MNVNSSYTRVYTSTCIHTLLNSNSFFLSFLFPFLLILLFFLMHVLIYSFSKIEIGQNWQAPLQPPPSFQHIEFSHPFISFHLNFFFQLFSAVMFVHKQFTLDVNTCMNTYVCIHLKTKNSCITLTVHSNKQYPHKNPFVLTKYKGRYTPLITFHNLDIFYINWMDVNMDSPT